MTTPEALISALHPLLPLSNPKRSLPINNIDEVAKKGLDALAKISVAKRASDVIAVALESNSKETKLYVASNGAVSDDLYNHLCAVWTELKAISENTFGSSTSPTKQKDLYRETVFRIYKFTWEKFQSRFNKRAEVFLAKFPSAGTKDRLTKKPMFNDDESALLADLKKIFQNLSSIVQMAAPTNENLDNLVVLLTQLHKIIEQLDRGKRGNTIIDRLQFIMSKQRNWIVTRYFDKVLTLRFCIASLFKLSKSKAHRAWFTKPEAIVRIPSMTLDYVANMGDAA